MLEVRNPYSSEVIGTFDAKTKETICSEFSAAQKFQSSWQKTPLGQRMRAISQFKDLLKKEESALARVLCQETGKPINQALAEVSATGERLDFFLNHIEDAIGDQNLGVRRGVSEFISLEPLGVIANISAWNYPYFVGLNVIVPALLTGNCVLYKPSEFATLTGLNINRLLHESGIPKRAFSCFVGGGEVGQELLSLPINGVFFTGSLATGKKVAEAVSGKMIRTQLELGGKDPGYVCEDASPITSAKSLSGGAFYNAGQSCCAVERIYVHEAVYEEFLSAFVSSVKGFEIGDPLKKSTYIGPLTRPAQMRLLEDQVADASSKGAKIICGGQRVGRHGNFFEPTILVDVNHDMRVMREESFGPIIGIQKVSDDDEATFLMNDTSYGLTACVFSRSQQRAGKILSGLKVGTAYWNCCDRVSPYLPWTGRNNSGMGVTLSIEGIRAFMAPKAWHMRGLR